MVSKKITDKFKIKNAKFIKHQNTCNNKCFHKSVEKEKRKNNMQNSYYKTSASTIRIAWIGGTPLTCLLVTCRCGCGISIGNYTSELHNVFNLFNHLNHHRPIGSSFFHTPHC